MSLETKYSFAESPQVSAFLQSDAFVRIIEGPVGSGKTTACCVEVMRRALEENPQEDGYRHYRALIVRNTKQQLGTTTMRTWREVFPKNKYGSEIKPGRLDNPATHHFLYPPTKDTPGLNLEVMFLALDHPEDVRKLLSLEVSLIYFNEIREIAETIYGYATGRTDRYPPASKGGAKFGGIIADTNQWEEDSWLQSLMEDHPTNVEFFTQEPAVLEVPREHPKAIQSRTRKSYIINPAAENRNGLPKTYYENQILTNTDDYIRCMLQCHPVPIVEGKPVIPGFRYSQHVNESIAHNPEQPTFLGFDVGSGTLQPAAVLIQKTVEECWAVLTEIVGTDIGLKSFVPAVRARILEATEGKPINWTTSWADPAGNSKNEISETRAIEYLNQEGGWSITPTSSNDPKLRIESIQNAVSRLSGSGLPALLVHPRCRVLIQGLSGSWQYRKLRISGDRFKERPDKNRFSHVCDALGYALLGGGESHASIMNIPRDGRTIKATRASPRRMRRLIRF